MSRVEGAPRHGFLNLLKPPGMTSHDVVAYIRTLFPGLKVGHGGTLDPGAAGVLPILLGKATKLAPYIQNLFKIYHAELYLGISTDTGDSFGHITGRSKPPLYEQAKLEKILLACTGEIEQLPPMFSAIKSKGKKLYEYARKGQVIERTPRKVNIYELSIITCLPPERILLKIKCSSGTYVRTLCEQLGEKLGCGGHMSFLLRTASGDFCLGNSCTLEELTASVRANSPGEVLLPADFPFRSSGHIVMEEAALRRFCCGQPLSLAWLTPKKDILSYCPKPVDGGVLAVYTTKGDFAALARWLAAGKNDFVLKPEKIWQQ